MFTVIRWTIDEYKLAYPSLNITSIPVSENAPAILGKYLRRFFVPRSFYVFLFTPVVC